MGMAARDHTRVGPRHPLGDDARVKFLVEPGGLRPRRSVADEDHRAVGCPEAALGRQPAEPGDALVPECVVRPFRRGLERLRDAVRHPGKRGRVVEIGDRDVGIAADDDGTVGLHLAQQVDGARGIRAIQREVPGDRDHVRLLAPDRAADGCEGDGVAVDVRQNDEPGHLGTMRPLIAELPRPE